MIARITPAVFADAVAAAGGTVRETMVRDAFRAAGIEVVSEQEQAGIEALTAVLVTLDAWVSGVHDNRAGGFGGREGDEVTFTPADIRAMVADAARDCQVRLP